MGGEERELPPAGWYPDPDGGSGRRRYWDGERWTDRYEQAEPSASGTGSSPGKRWASLRLIATVFFALGWIVAVLGGIGVIAAAVDAGNDPSTTTVIFGERVENDPNPVAIAIVGGIVVALYSLFLFAASGFIRLMLAIEDSSRRTAEAVDRLAAR